MGAEQLALLLGSLVKSLLEYKTARDKAKAAGVVTDADGSVKSDAELIALFRGDAVELKNLTAELLAKYGAPPPPPAPPANEDPGR